LMKGGLFGMRTSNSFPGFMNLLLPNYCHYSVLVLYTILVTNG